MCMGYTKQTDSHVVDLSDPASWILNRSKALTKEDKERFKLFLRTKPTFYMTEKKVSLPARIAYQYNLKMTRFKGNLGAIKRTLQDVVLLSDINLSSLHRFLVNSYWANVFNQELKAERLYYNFLYETGQIDWETLGSLEGNTYGRQFRIFLLQFFEWSFFEK
jgi:hypothetical protein